MDISRAFPRFMRPAVLLGIAFLLLVTGCNTIEGAGKDIERAGEEVQEAVD